MLYSALLFVPSSTASANAVRCIGREAIARVINKTNQMQKNSVPRGPVYTLYRPPPSHASKVDASLSRGFHVQVSLTFLSLLTASVGRSGHPQHPYTVSNQVHACWLSVRSYRRIAVPLRFVSCLNSHCCQPRPKDGRRQERPFSLHDRQQSCPDMPSLARKMLGCIVEHSALYP